MDIQQQQQQLHDQFHQFTQHLQAQSQQQQVQQQQQSQLIINNDQLQNNNVDKKTIRAMKPAAVAAASAATIPNIIKQSNRPKLTKITKPKKSTSNLEHTESILIQSNTTIPILEHPISNIDHNSYNDNNHQLQYNNNNNNNDFLTSYQQQQQNIVQPYSLQFSSVPQAQPHQQQLSNDVEGSEDEDDEDENETSRSANSSSKDKYNYKCKYCIFSTKFKVHIIEHMFELHSIYLMECPEKTCKKQFKDEWKLKRHLESNRDHPTLKYQFKNFMDVMKLYVDISLYKPGYKCPVCESYYLQTFDLLCDHVASMHVGYNLANYFICKQCGQIFRNNYKLKSHVINVHSGKKRNSGAAAAKVSNKLNDSSIIIDLTTNSTPASAIVDDSIAYCSQCKKTYNKKAEFLYHIHDLDESQNVLNEQITNEHEQQCHLCNKVLKDYKRYQRHVKTQHGMNEKGEPLIDCPVCEKNFFNRQQLERHMRMHEHWVADTTPQQHQQRQQQQQENIHMNNSVVVATAADLEAANNNFTYAIDCWLSNAALNAATKEIAKSILDENNNNTLNLSNFNNNQTIATTNNNNNKITADYRTTKSLFYCFECELCKIYYKSNKLLYKHKRSVHKLKPVFKCLLGDQCAHGNGQNGQFDTLDEYIQHSRIHSQKNIYCIRCKEKFTSKSMLRNHMKNVHYRVHHQQEFGCNHCRIKFKTKNDLDEHNRNTTHGKTQRTRKQAITTTRSNNSNNNTVTTSAASKTTTTTVLTPLMPPVTQHQRQHHAPRQPQQQQQQQQQQTAANTILKCYTCFMEFQTLNNLHNHLATHSELKLFVCEICKEPFNTRKDLSKHSSTHDTSKHKTCKICSMMFKTAFHLKRHELTRHTDVRPFKCEQCDMTFARKDKLKQHQAKHISHPLYQCHQCNKGFYRKEHLKDHEISKHSKQYPFTCESCTKGFVHAKDLYRHIRVRHLGMVASGPNDKPLKKNPRKYSGNDATMNNRGLDDDDDDEDDDEDEEDGDDDNDDVDSPLEHNDAGQQQQQTAESLNHHDMLDDLHILNEKQITANSSSTVQNAQLLAQLSTGGSLLAHQHQQQQHHQLDAATRKGGYSKLFKCQKCDRDFYYENHFKKHYLTKHSNKHLYLCSFCKSGFATKSTAKLHVESNVNYECDSCKKIFRNKSQAQRHIANMHSGSGGSGGGGINELRGSDCINAEVIDLCDKNLLFLDSISLDGTQNSVKKDDETPASNHLHSLAIPLLTQHHHQQDQQHHILNLMLPQAAAAAVASSAGVDLNTNTNSSTAHQQQQNLLTNTSQIASLVRQVVNLSTPYVNNHHQQQQHIENTLHQQQQHQQQMNLSYKLAYLQQNNHQQNNYVANIWHTNQQQQHHHHQQNFDYIFNNNKDNISSNNTTNNHSSSTSSHNDVLNLHHHHQQHQQNQLVANFAAQQQQQQQAIHITNNIHITQLPQLFDVNIDGLGYTALTTQQNNNRDQPREAPSVAATSAAIYFPNTNYQEQQQQQQVSKNHH